jgi:hypothetical protein
MPGEGVNPEKENSKDEELENDVLDFEDAVIELEEFVRVVRHRNLLAG